MTLFGDFGDFSGRKSRFRRRAWPGMVRAGWKHRPAVFLGWSLLFSKFPTNFPCFSIGFHGFPLDLLSCKLLRIALWGGRKMVIFQKSKICSSFFRPPPMGPGVFPPGFGLSQGCFGILCMDFSIFHRFIGFLGHQNHKNLQNRTSGSLPQGFP